MLRVHPQGPATGGIEPFDVITALDGEPLTDSRQLAERLRRCPPGVTIELMLLRRGAVRAQQVELAPRPVPAGGAPGSEQPVDP